MNFFTACYVNKFGSPDHWKMHFQHAFWLQSIHCPLLINNIFPLNISDKVYKTLSPKLVHKSWWHTPKPGLLVGHTNLFCNQTWQGQSVMFSLNLLLLKRTLRPFFMDGVQLSQLHQHHYEETLELKIKSMLFLYIFFQETLLWHCFFG